MARKAKAKKNFGFSGEQVKALEAFCAKQGVEVKIDEEFNLMEFLFSLSEKVISLIPTALKIERDVGKLLQKEGKESENFGGSPLGGSTVTLNLKEDPYTGYVLEADDEDESEDDEDEDESEEYESEDDDDESEDDEDDEDDDDVTDDEFYDEDESEDYEDDEDESEDDEDEDDDWEDDEPKNVKNKKKKIEKEKKKKEKDTKVADREERRKQFEKDMKKCVKMAYLDSIGYRDLLMVAGLFGAKKPMKIGKADELRIWIEKAAKKKFGKGKDKKKEKASKKKTKTKGKTKAKAKSKKKTKAKSKKKK